MIKTKTKTKNKKLNIEIFKDAIEAEYKRQALAGLGNYNELFKMYKKNMPQIKDLNCERFWNKKFQKRTLIKDVDNMTMDRMKTVYSWLLKEGRLLDIGAGAGLLEELLIKNKKVNLYANDISTKSIERLKSKYSGIFRIESVYKMKYPSDFFDSIVLLEVMEHIRPSEIIPLLNKINKMLKRNGQFIVSVPINEGLEKMSTNPNGHLRIYTEDLVKAELSFAGFEVTRVKKLYAFENHYVIKKIISTFLKKKWKPNVLVLLSVKK